MENMTYMYYNVTKMFENEEKGHGLSSIILMIVLAVSGVMGLAGNITVVALVSTRRHLQNITNMYLLHRSVADILSQIMFPFTIATIAQKSFNFGYYFCIIHSFLVQIGYMVSLVSLVLLAVDCYLASRPRHNSLQYRWKVLKVAAGVTWGAAALMAVPVYFFTEYSKQLSKPYTHTFCVEGPLFASNLSFPWFGFFYAFVIVPVIILWIFVSLSFPPGFIRASNFEGVSEGEEKDSVASLRSFILILSMFTTSSHLPYWVIKMATHIITIMPYIHISFFCVLELSFSINPVLYLWLRKDLKQRVSDCLPSRPSSHLPLEDIGLGRT